MLSKHNYKLSGYSLPGKDSGSSWPNLVNIPSFCIWVVAEQGCELCVNGVLDL